MKKTENKQGSGFRVQGSGFSGRQNSSLSIHYSSLIPHPSSLIPQPNQKPGNKLPGPRRGVLLLLVLALLALFALVAVAFVIISGQSQRSSKIMQRVDQTLEEPQKLLNDAMMQVARGPSNPVSVMGLHSLLEDMYGNTSRVGAVVNNTAYPYSAIAGGQLIQIGVQLPVPASNRGTLPAPMLSSPLNWCSGMVITFLNGPRTMGHSTRIVAHIPANTAVTPNTPDYFQIVADDAITYGNIVADLGDLYDPVTKIQEPLFYLVNAAPFSGTGFGFNPATGKLDLQYVLDLKNTNSQLKQCLSTDPTKLTLTSTASTFATALLPNLPIPAYSLCPDPLIQNAQGNPPGGANEDYDALDYQNMIMATPPLPSVLGQRNIPSLHRPALVNYWYNELANDPSGKNYEATFWNRTGLNANQKKAALQSPTGIDQSVINNITNFKRRIIMRPLQEDNPDFTGSNPNVTTANPWEPINGSWDVDNDGDGMADSIWVDFGLPVRAAKDGKLYKPLFAILCVDMDGRLNLNAHGDRAQTLAGYYPAAGTPPDPTNFPDNYFATHISLPTNRGQGFGPADINLYYTLYSGVSPDPFNDSAGRERYQRLLSGNVTTGIEGRYGSDGVPATAGSAYFQSLGAAGNSFAPGVGSYNDYLSANKWFEYDSIYKNSILKTNYPTADLLKNVTVDNKFSVNSFVPDPQANYVVGLDPAGRPILQSYNQTDKFDVPYELNIGLKTQRGLQSPSSTPDNPFSVDELERILRPYDRDAASLPARLAALTFDSALNKSVLIDKRHEVTTDSWDVPVFSAGLPTHILLRVQGDLAAGNITSAQIPWLNPHNVTDLLKAYYYYQMVTSGGVVPGTAATQADSMVKSLTAANLLELFPPEMLAGLRMNINRPFPGPGTGASSDPSAFGKAALWQSLGAGGSYGDFWFGQMPDYPDGTYDAHNAPFATRQRYARYLYVLATLLRDPSGQAQWFTETLSAAEKEQLAKRRIAQWAINAACFKTNDSIMVAFEYDADPLGYDITTYKINGWRVDGRIGTISNPSTDDALSYRGLVWGCKPPELILTETLAFHDRRIADTRWEGPGGTKTTDPTPHDPDFDQTRIPQGSAFFELYCARDLHGSTPPPDLYDPATNKLDLGRLAPADGNGRQYPVWRLVIGAGNLANTQNNVVNRFANNTDSFTPQTQQYVDAPPYLQYAPSVDETSLLPKTFSGATQITIDRIVWFANLQPITKTVSPTAYHADADRIYYNKPGTAVLLDRGHYVVVGPRTLTTLGLTNDIMSNPKYTKLPIGAPSDQAISLPAPDSPTIKDLISKTWNTNIIDPSMIKMPLGIVAAGGGPGTNWPTGWASGSPAAANGIGISISEPLFSAGNYYPEPKVKGPDNVTEWYGDWQMTNTDPLTNGGYFRDTPLDKDTNRPLGDPNEKHPYSGTALNYKTAFLQRLANPLAPYDPATNPYLTVDWMPIDLTIFNGEENSAIFDPDVLLSAVPSPAVNFATRQRGNAAANYNIWAPISDDPSNSAKAGSNAYFDYSLKDHHSLGYLNQAFQPFITSVPTRPSELYGDPSVKPFPWLPWFGRPYVNQMELMLVPASHPARLLWEFQPFQAGVSRQYNPTLPSEAPFPQLLNFLQSGNASGMNQFGRILDYVGVPSWFAGTEIQANPNLISPGGIPSFPGSHTFFPPYNNISTYREPGRINLNTIYSQDVFNGLQNGSPSPTWGQFVNSRGDNYAAMNPAYPAEFNNPFRSFGSVYWSPSYQYLPSPSPEINATYLRPTTTGSSTPLFQQAPGLQQDVNNTDRNAFFHYQGLERLGNLVTTRSNVYSVWITVGYFEVKPHLVGGVTTVDAAHPDGYELGQEMGSDTGEIVRHRAFYMIDRSIPVGFQRGQDLNVEKAIILKRYVE